jgi:hypothetical protein
MRACSAPRCTRSRSRSPEMRSFSRSRRRAGLQRCVSTRSHRATKAHGGNELIPPLWIAAGTLAWRPAREREGNHGRKSHSRMSDLRPRFPPRFARAPRGPAASVFGPITNDPGLITMSVRLHSILSPAGRDLITAASDQHRAHRIESPSAGPREARATERESVAASRSMANATCRRGFGLSRASADRPASRRFRNSATNWLVASVDLRVSVAPC